MKVVYHISGGVVGGAETQVAYLVNNLPDDVMPLVTYDHPAIEKYIFKNIKTKNVFRVFSANQLARKLLDFKPDIIQFYHDPKFYEFLGKIHLPNTKVVEIAHNRSAFPWDCSTYPKDLTSVLVCVSPDAKNHYISKRGEDVPLVIIPNGVDSSRFFPVAKPRRPERLVGGFCGRLEAGDGKGVETLIKVVSQLPVDFELVGYDFGNYRQKLKDSRNIRIHQHIPDIERYYQKWDFFVSCSPLEGFGLAIAEALSCGLPSVIYDCGGICHYLEHGKHAYIAKDAADVKKGIETIIAGETYQPTSIDFSSHRMVREYLKLYDELKNLKPYEIMGKKEITSVKIESSDFTLGVVPNSWQGIKKALEPRCDDFCDPAAAIRYCYRKKPSHIVFGGFMSGWYPVIKTLKEATGAHITITYHGTASLNEFDDQNRNGLVHAISAVKMGYADCISFPHEGMARAFNSLYNVSAIFEANKVVPIDVSRLDIKKLEGLHVGIFGTGMPWKNVDTQILAAAVTPGLTMLHLQNLHHPELPNQLGMAYKVHPYYHKREEFYKLAGQMTINLAVSFTESFGYFALESLMLGVPAIVSATTPSYRLAEGALKKCIVTHIDDPAAISDAILDVMDSYDSVIEEGRKMIKKLSTT